MTLESYANCNRCLATVDSTQTQFIKPDSRQLLGANIPVRSVLV